MRTLEEAKYAFEYVPIDEEQRGNITIVTDTFEKLLEVVFTEVPESADRTAAVRKLWEAKSLFVQAISHPAKGAETLKSKAS